MDLQLVKYSQISEAEYRDYVREWEDEDRPFVPIATRPVFDSFDKMQEKWRADETDVALAKGFVPASLYFFREGHRLVGAIHFRHYLNDRLRKNGGHVGYGIRESCRGRGLATRMLSLLIEELRSRGSQCPDSILLHCDDSNLASARAIERCGGRLLEKALFEGVLNRAYSIPLTVGLGAGDV